MPGFFIYSSNHMEQLVDMLVHAVLAQPLSDIFSSDTIIVNSRGMETWLKQEIAKRRGIAANISFPFLNTFIDELLDQLLHEQGDNTVVLSRQVLAWKIFAILLRHETSANPLFKPLITYIDDGQDRQFKAVQLALRLADLFDQYQVYRPQMLKQWRENTNSHTNLKKVDQWQPALFLQVLDETGAFSRDRCFQLLFENFTAELLCKYERLTVFGMSSTPPVYLQLCNLLSTVVPVHFFLFNPCREEWTYDVSPQRQLKASEQLLRQGVRVDDQFLDVGHPLLSSWGLMGQEFLAELLDQVDPADWDSCYIVSSKPRLLQTLQDEIVTRSDGAPPEGRKQLDRGDRSVQVQVCHSPRREVEVMKDYLLQLFAENPDLSPHDVIVMAPDISDYAPYIDAVFAAADRHKPHFIPYTIADRTIGQESRLINAFLNLLQLHKSRFKTTEVLDLLSIEAVATARGLDQSDLDLVRRWVSCVGIHWGIDAEQHRQFTGCAYEEGGWQFGLRRLLLGYAMRPDADADADGLFTPAHEADILPYDDLDPGDAEILGEFAAFAQELFELKEQFSRPRPAAAWYEFLHGVLERFFVSTNETYADMRLLTQALEAFAEGAAAAGCEQALEADTVQYWLSQALARETAAGGFLRGGVTLCSLLPMRSIPAEVVYLLGMDDARFPRPDLRRGYDLMNQPRRRCDRSRRIDDRYMFLEAILAARRCLCISYCGRSPDTNQLQPPSVLLAELLDYISANFTVTEVDGAVMAVADSCELPFVTEHKLQGFHPDYFNCDNNGNELFSFSEQNWRAAQALLLEHRRPFFLECGAAAELLPEVVESEGFERITLAELMAFFRNPCRYLLQRRLKIHLQSNVVSIVDNEPLDDPDQLLKYQWNEVILAAVLQERDEAHCYRLLKAAGALPPGAEGRLAVKEQFQGVHEFCHSALTPFDGPVQLKSLLLSCSALIEHDIAFPDLGMIVTGRTCSCESSHHVRARFADVKPKDRLAASIEQLALAVTRDCVQNALVVGKDGWEKLGPARPDTARQQLRRLLELYRQGLRRPLPFIPELSWEAFAKKEDAFNMATAVQAAWEGGYRRPGQKDDPYYRRCFADEGPHQMVATQQEFWRLADEVFAPLAERSVAKW